jgi:hypothetical protein
MQTLDAGTLELAGECLHASIQLKMSDGKTLRPKSKIGDCLLLNVPMFNFIRGVFSDSMESYTEEALIDSGFIVRGSRTVGKSRPRGAPTYRILTQEEASRVAGTLSSANPSLM